MIPWLLAVAPPVPVTWIKVDRPRFDLVGLILGAFKLTGLLLAVALGLGVGLGVFFILRRRRQGAGHLLSLDLQAPL